MLFFLVACILPAFFVSLSVTGFLIKKAPSLGLVDQPGERKVHTTPTPLGGGIGIWSGVVLTLGAAFAVVHFLAGRATIPAWIPAELAVHFDGVLFRSRRLWAMISGGTVLALLGLVDDRMNLPWLFRLCVQATVAIAMVWFGIHVTLFVPYPIVGQVISVFWIIVLVNAFNFLDNMDALSAGIALVAASVLAAVMLTSTSEPRWLVAGLLLILVGSLSGFLFWNRPPARIFMGDSGSYFIGLLMACLTIQGTFYDRGSRHVVLAPLCVLAVPLYDFCSVTVIRLLDGRSPFHADKSHFSHRLVELGLHPTYAVLTIHLATFTTGIGALLLYRVSGWKGACLIVAMIAAVLAIVAILETAGRRTEKETTSPAE